MNYTENLSLQEHHERENSLPEPELVMRIREYLEDRHLQYTPATTVAKRFFMSTDTLQRRLRGAGVTYTELVDDERRRRFEAIWPCSNAELMDDLDYSDRNSVFRAVQRWCGASIRELRKQKAGQ